MNIMIKLWVPVLYIFLSMRGIECKKCPDYSVQQNFNMSQYLGKWYQHATINPEYFQGKGRCMFSIFSATKKSNVMKVHHEGIKLSTNQVDYLDGNARLINTTTDEAKFTITFPKWWFKVNGINSILSTDYTSYSIVYSCQTHLYYFNSASYWILTREQEIDQNTVVKIKAALAIFSLKYSDFQLTDQDDCTAG